MLFESYNNNLINYNENNNYLNLFNQPLNNNYSSFPNPNVQNINNIENPFFTDKKIINFGESEKIFNPKYFKEKTDKSIKNSFNDNEEDKSLLFFKSHNFTNDNEIIKRDEKINEDKKFYENLSISLEEDMKCCICLNRYIEPLLCPYCHHFFCRNCIYKWYDENKNSCVYCRKNMEIESFIRISAFRKILPFLDVLKDNNNSYFNNQIQNNLYKIIIICSNKIHEINVEENNIENNNINNNENGKEENNIDSEKDKENKYNKKLNEIKADYYCFDCKKPFCSDCICINDDYSNCGHSNDHSVFNIEILKEMKLFDLLYEKEKNNTIDELEKMNLKINESIIKLNKTKSNTLLFIDYIKNIFIEYIEKKIKELKEMVENNEKEINKIKHKFNDIDKFIQNLKDQKNIKSIKNTTEIENSLKMINDFNILPSISKNIIKENLKFKGNIRVVEIINKIIDFDKINFDKCETIFNYSCSFIIINENFKKQNNVNMNPFLFDFNENDDKNNDNNNKENNKIKFLIKYKRNIKEIEENRIFFPILFNNENNYIAFEEIKEKDDIYFLKEKIKNPFTSNYFDDIDNINQKYYRVVVDINNLILYNDNINNNKNNSNIEKIYVCLYGLAIS